MSGTAVRAATRTQFFLSYAHTAPLAGARQAPVDHWVKTLFEDLSAAVQQADPTVPDDGVGFFDGLLTAGEDWGERITGALGEAEVFVPLCSPGYFAMSWPGREWSCFDSRLAGRPEAQARRHIIPVLWAPLSRPKRMPVDVDLLSLAPDRPAYAENGLRALNMLARYRDTYHEVVGRLARSIVATARSSPLGASTVQPVNSYPSAFHSGEALDDFIVAVAAPTADTVPDGRDTGPYGDRAIDWRPFGDRERLSLADHAVIVAERLNFSTSVLAAADAVRVPVDTPAVVLIDPWITEGGGDEAQLDNLRRLFEGERRHWTLPLVVLDPADAQSERDGGRLLGQLDRVLDEIGALTSETAERGAEGITTIGDFVAVMPVMVTEAERQYIKHSRDFRQAGQEPPGADARNRPLDGTRERPHD